MSDFEDFMKNSKGLSFNIEMENESPENILASDVLFHTPIISLALLVIAYERKELTVGEMSNWIGAVLSNSFWGTRSAHRKLEWSIVLRNRYADALIFLEATHLASVKGKKRVISVTDDGKNFLQKSHKRADRFGQLVRGFKVAAAEIETKGFSLL